MAPVVAPCTFRSSRSVGGVWRGVSVLDDKSGSRCNGGNRLINKIGKQINKKIDLPGPRFQANPENRLINFADILLEIVCICLLENRLIKNTVARPS